MSSNRAEEWKKIAEALYKALKFADCDDEHYDIGNSEFIKQQALIFEQKLAQEKQTL